MSLTNLSKVTTSGIATGTSLLISNVNSSGVVTASSFSGPLSGDATGLSGTPNITVGVVTASSVTISGDLTVEGTYSTLDTILTEVDKLEVAANNSTVGVAITQSGSGDILRLYDSASQVVTVKDGGSVGIGTDNPTVNLEIGTPSDANTFFKMNSSSAAFLQLSSTDTRANIIAGRTSGNSDLTFMTSSGGTNYERMRIQDDGNVGIGTDNPGVILDVRETKTAGSTQIRLYNTDNSNTTTQTAEVSLTPDSRALAGAGVKAFKENADFSTNAGRDISLALNVVQNNSQTEAVRITSSGNVGIGTDNPRSKLDINGTDSELRFYRDAGDRFGGLRYTGSKLTLKLPTGDHFVVDDATGIEKVRITSTGSVGIGTDTPDKKLRVEGDARITGTLTMGTASVSIDGTVEYPSIRPTLDLNFAGTKILDDRITFYRDSVGTYTDEDGLVKYASNNTPRFDHDPVTGESLGLLIEESRTNRFVTSIPESTYWSLTNVGTVTTNAITENYATAPDGTTTATRWQWDIGSTGSDRAILRQGTGSLGSSTLVTLSIYLKSNTGSNQLVALHADGGIYSASVVTVTPEWQRFRYTYTSAIGVNNGVEAKGGDGSGTHGTQLTEQGDILVWGAQMEIGGFPTSYIPTSGSTVTRAADFAKITGTNFTDFYGNTDHSFFVDFDLKNTTSTDSMAILTLPNATYPWLLYRYVDDYWKSYNGSDSIVNVSSTYSQTNNRFAFAIGSSNGSSAYNGSLTQTDQSALRTGLYSNASSILLFTRGTDFIPSGYLKQLKYYNKRLPNAQLQGLTQQ